MVLAVVVQGDQRAAAGGTVSRLAPDVPARGHEPLDSTVLADEAQIHNALSLAARRVTTHP
jgi:hypothetical protein